MGRRLRPHLSGVAFHLTARCQGKAPLFEGMQRLVAARIMAAPQRSDAALLAWAVMPNHIHLVVRQGDRPLSQFMQPLLRRISLLVQRRTGMEGHTFERRYHSSPCLDADYLRNVIAYVHLNGVRAGLASRVDDFEWTSHAAYIATARRSVPSAAEITFENVLRLFAARDQQTMRQCVRDYRAFLHWRVAMDEHNALEANGLRSSAPLTPTTIGGDAHWLHEFARDAAVIIAKPARRPELGEIALSAIAEVAPGMDIELLRCGARNRDVVRVRRHFILHAKSAGFSGQRIANFLRVGSTTVSKVIVASLNRPKPPAERPTGDPPTASAAPTP